MQHVIILPGWQHSAKHWEQVKEVLAINGIACTIIDLPGFGTEPAQPELQTISDVAQWTKDKVAEVKSIKSFSSFVLVGHSYGGRITALLAAEKIAGLEKIVLIGSPNIYRTNFATKIKKVLAELLAPVKTYIPESFRARFRSPDFAVVRGTELQTLFSAIVGDNQTETLKKITLPSLLLWGEFDDQVTVTTGAEIAQYIQNATFEVIDGVGHNIHLEKPALLAAKIAAYAKN